MSKDISVEDLDKLSPFNRNLFEYIRAGYQCLYIPSAEEHRLEKEIKELGKAVQMGVVTWDVNAGFSEPEKLSQNKALVNPGQALAQVLNDDEKTGPFARSRTIIIFRDLDDYWSLDPSIRRIIRTMAEGNKLNNSRRRCPIIFTSSKANGIHEKLKPHITVVDFALPDEAQIRNSFEFIRTAISASSPEKANCPDELSEDIIGALRGLTSIETENTLARCLARHNGFCPEMLATIKDEKAQIIKKSEVLTYIPEEQMVKREDIGGYENLLAFIDRRKLAYSKKAKSLGIDLPKGIVVAGIPGTGKSMVAAAVSRVLGLPGYIMDVGSVFGSLVGESESRLRDALRTVEAQNGCVLMLDEADKALGGANDSSGDSGVTRRVFGQLLSWLANKKDRTFVIMTLNRTKGLPLEFLRAGRFDATFYTELPNPAERRQILNIHLRKRNVNPDDLGLQPAEWDTLVEKTNEWVGSEIEEMVRESRYLAFERRESGTPTYEELIEAAASIIPLSKSSGEELDAIRQHFKDRARPVSAAYTEKKRHAVDRTRNVSVQ